MPAATGPEQVVVNGMSPSNRGGRWSNSGMVVEIHPEDVVQENLLPEGVPTDDALVMMYFQEKMERECWLAGGMRQTAPAQRMADFTRKKLSYDLPATSYSPGVVSSPLHFWMPSFITGLPAIRPYFARFPHQRSTHDRGGDTHLVPRAHRARPRNPATHHRERPFPLWRRSGLCRRHRLGRHGWRTVCRSRGTHDGSGESLKFKVQSSRPKTQKQAKLLSTPVLLNS